MVEEKYILGSESKLAKDGITKLFRIIANIDFENKFYGKILLYADTSFKLSNYY